MALGEGQSNPSTSGDAGRDHHEDFGNEYGPLLPTQEELREMEHRRLVGEATNLMLNFAKDPKLAKYMSETAFQDVQAQLKATTTSPPKPDSKKQYSEKELEAEIDARLARILGAQKQGKKHDRKRKKSTDFPGYLGSQSTFDKAKKHKKHAAVPSSSSSSSESSSESSEEERRSKKRSRRHRLGKGNRKTRKSRSRRADDSSTEDSSTDSSDCEDGHFYANKKNFYKANQYDFLEDKSKKVREFKEGGQSIKDIMPRRPNPLWAEHTNVVRVVNISGQAGSGTRTWVCKYCGEQMTSTITRVLKHLSGIGTTGHCGGCEAVPPALRDALILEHFPLGYTTSSQSGAAATSAEDALQDALLGDIGGSVSALPSFAGTSRKRAPVSQAEDEGASASTAKFLQGAGMPPAPTRGSNAPCSTLFVANLGSTCTELEVTQAFSRFPGFRKVKMQSRGGLPVAFVEYQDTGCSTQALSQLQNMMLPSSVQGGIRLEYAKARMGQPGRERLQQQVNHAMSVWYADC
ncbi:hypothetical protein L7F22_007378 [Adiantum nelumboides]|nr:hypothetical protein [Adiantum nelumboides]